MEFFWFGCCFSLECRPIVADIALWGRNASRFHQQTHSFDLIKPSFISFFALIMHVFARWSIIRRLNSSHITTKTANATLEFQKQFRQFDFSITFRHFLRLRHISSECIWNAISGRHIHTIALTQLENIYCACVKRNCNLKQFFPTITTATWWRKKRVTWNSQGSSKLLIDYTNQRKKYTDCLFHISIMSYRMFSIEKPAMTQSAQQKNASN